MPILGGSENTGAPIFRNREVLVWENGQVRTLSSQGDIQKFLRTLSPEEYERFKTQYRFTPVRNNTGNPYYTGAIKDLL